MRTTRIYKAWIIQPPSEHSLPRMQIKFNKRAVRKVIAFMKQLWDAPILSKHILFEKQEHFDKLKHKTWFNSMQKKPEPTMDLETFLRLLEENKSRIDTFVLQIGDPDPHRIIFGACFKDESKDFRFALFDCMYSNALKFRN